MLFKDELVRNARGGSHVEERETPEGNATRRGATEQVDGREGSGWGRGGEGSASGGGDGGTAGKIVIAGWTGEPCVASKSPVKTSEPHPAAARRRTRELRGYVGGQVEGRGEGRSLLNR